VYDFHNKYNIKITFNCCVGCYVLDVYVLTYLLNKDHVVIYYLLLRVLLYVTHYTDVINTDVINALFLFSVSCMLML